MSGKILRFVHLLYNLRLFFFLKLFKYNLIGSANVKGKKDTRLLPIQNLSVIPGAKIHWEKNLQQTYRNKLLTLINSCRV